MVFAGRCTRIRGDSKPPSKKPASLKNLVRRIWDLDRTLFIVVFRFKWGPLTAVMRAFTVVGTAGFLWGTLAAGAFLLNRLRAPPPLVSSGAGALTLSVVYPALAPGLALAGFLVALSRVYLGVHYPFDVLAGVLIGVVTGGAALAPAGRQFPPLLATGGGKRV